MATQIDNLNFEKIWKMIDEFDFQITHKVPANYLCTLCESLMKDARICQCGCRFCNKCITEYVSNGNSFCPGKSNECKDESLNPKVNIWIDHKTNRRIGKVRVNCPVEMCSHNDCLMDIEEHVRSCASQSAQCPYSHIGCDYLILEEENVNHHLKTHKDYHIQIMIKKIELYKGQKENLQNQIKSLQDNCNAIQIRMEEEKRQLSLAKDAEIRQLKEQLDAQQKDTKKYKTNLKAYFDANPKEFSWTATDWTYINEDKTPLYSEEFYTYNGGYQMQLVLKHDGSCYQLYLVMVGGDYKNILLWPAKLDITAGIVSNSTGLFAKSQRQIINVNQNSSVNCFSFVPSNMTTGASKSNNLSLKCVVTVVI